jgi:mercuric ion transport protein
VSNSASSKPLLAAILAATGASACCILPLVLLTLGIGGAWMSNLTAMQPYSPYLSGLTLLILAWIFYTLYVKKSDCNEQANEQVCRTPDSLKRQRRSFWIISFVLCTMLAFPYYASNLFA